VTRRIRIATVLEGGQLDVLAPVIMTTTRWVRMSEALADRRRDRAIAYMLAHHTWGHRAQIYDDLLRAELGGAG
jgi:hypothetical protein